MVNLIVFLLLVGSCEVGKVSVSKLGKNHIRQPEAQRVETRLPRELNANKISRVSESEDACSDLWFIEENGHCRCGTEIYGAVECNEHTKEVKVLDCYCMTTDNASNITVVGKCFYNCVNISSDYLDYIYHPVPSSCNYLHRKGTLCGDCDHENKYFPPAYSYNMECIQCADHPHSWWEYTAVAFLPLTVFIVIILLFRISVVSPKLHAFVFLAQNLAAPVSLRIMLSAMKHASPLVIAMFKIYTTVYGIWNLDFFRTVIPGICLEVTTLQVLALDYLVAVYPMLLMVIAYTLVELHGYGFKVMLYLWRPFHYFFARFRREWDIQTTIVDTFASFFLLSTTKLFSVSFDLLIPTELHTASGSSLGLYLYYDPNIKYFNETHLPYALLALAVLGLFILLPLCLLVLSPLRCVQKCTTRVRVLKEFLYAFQQYYKDGRNGTTDCRWFAGFYILVSFTLFLTYACTLNGYGYVVGIIEFTIAAIIVLLVQPYRKEYAVYNVLDTVLFILQALFCAALTYLNVAGLKQRVYLVISFPLLWCVCSAPLIYIAAIVIRWTWKRRGRQFCEMDQALETDGSESLPDRLSRPNQYEDSFGFVPSARKNTSKELLH